MIRVNLMGLPKERKHVRAPLVTFEGGVPLVLLAVVLLAVAGWTYVQHNRLQTEIAQLQMNAADLQRELQDLQRIKEEYDANLARREALTARINVITALQARQSGPVDLLSTLATAVVNTDSLWLVGLTQTGQTISIEGSAVNVRAVADFLTRLLNARVFTTVDLQETSQDPSQRDADRFTFTLNGQLATPPAPGTAPST
jgi:Tfp pilus assembly protein PilN